MSYEAERLREQTETRFECRATLEHVIAVESPSDRHVTLSVHVFRLNDHPITRRAYAWEDEGRFFAMQHGWFIQSPKDAVKEASAGTAF
ncbi:MAG: hypothetical protein AB7H66_01460 [Hyphomonadaceae bacterium]